MESLNSALMNANVLNLDAGFHRNLALLWIDCPGLEHTLPSDHLHELVIRCILHVRHEPIGRNRRMDDIDQ